MGLKCSLLGHAFDPAGVERDREEQGSEVVTVVKELEQCSRCGTERVVSENTEVTSVVEPDEVAGDVERGAGDAGAGDAAAGPAADPTDSGSADAPGTAGDADGPDEDVVDGSAAEAAAAVDELAQGPEQEEYEARDPTEEDAEILTEDDGPQREPGEWPDEPDGDDDADAPGTVVEDVEIDEGEADADASGNEAESDEGDGERPVDPDPEAGDDESLSGITVPEGSIACEECEFTVDAESSYRDGDPCPECGAWLVAERDA